VATTGFEDFGKGASEPGTRTAKKMWSVGRKWEYIISFRKAKKFIPGILFAGREAKRKIPEISLH
jgi:hypothetical protein